IAVDPRANGSDWHCERHSKPAIEKCELHLFNPTLISGDQIDADQQANSVTYRMADGSTFIDGMVAS
ncbi:MAG: hypothetical protein ACRC6I_18070, partial [Paracoccaceae bacterium]